MYSLQDLLASIDADRRIACDELHVAVAEVAVATLDAAYAVAWALSRFDLDTLDGEALYESAANAIAWSGVES